MKLYLSSYKIGDESEKLKALVGENTRTAYISNAMDVSSRVQSRETRENEDIADLQNLGLQVEGLDLRDYFGKPAELETFLQNFGLIWVCGGNTFVLRQAMKLSGFDDILQNFREKDMVYGGYSAGVCVLAPSLKGLHHVDDPNQTPYGIDTIWEGIGILDYLVLPHYKSDHPESADIDIEVAYCIEHNIAHRPLRDGEVIIIE